MRFNNKANYIKLLDAIRPLSAKTEDWLRRCDAYKYGGETISQIRTAIGARPKFQIDAPVSTREDLRALMSLKDERFKKAYANSALYYRGLESSFFGAHFILDGSLNEDALDKLVIAQIRGAIGSWALPYDNVRFPDSCFDETLEDCIFEQSDLASLKELRDSCSEGAVFLTNHRFSNLFLIRLLERINFNFVTFANDGACFSQTIGNPDHLFCSSIFSDAEAVKKLRDLRQSKKVILTMTDPVYGGETYVHRDDDRSLCLDMHGLRIGKALRLPVYFLSLHWDCMIGRFRINATRNEAQDMKESAESYVRSLKQDWLSCIEIERGI